MWQCGLLYVAMQPAVWSYAACCMWLCGLVYVAMQPAVWSYAACCVAGPGFWRGHII